MIWMKLAEENAEPSILKKVLNLSVSGHVKIISVIA